MKPHSDPSAKPSVGEVTVSQAEYQALKQQAAQAAEYLDKWQRAVADLDNLRKRSEKERAEQIKWANESLLLGLLPVIDSFDRALESLKAVKDGDPTADGVRLIHRQLHDWLAEEQLTRIKTQGERFDPHLHEAVGDVETTAQPEQTIVEEIQSGYTLRGKLLRHAIVKVAKKPQTPAKSSPKIPGMGNFNLGDFPGP